MCSIGYIDNVESIMRNLVRRYVTVQQRRAESQGVTEDDVNEIKQDVSAFRCELVEILRNSGMNTSTASGGGAPAAAGGKKNRQKERRLMKGFNIAPTNSMSLAPVDEFLASLHHQHSEQSHAHHEMLGLLGHKARTASASSLSSDTYGTRRFKRSSSHKRRWGTIIEAAKSGRVSRLIGRSRSEDSVCNTGAASADSDGSDSASEHSPEPPRRLRERDTTSIAHQRPPTYSHGISALVALKKKRKKFSETKHASPDSKRCSSDNKKKTIQFNTQMLKRASSVPTRVAEAVQMPGQPHVIGRSPFQQDSTDTIRQTDIPGLTPSTTEESVGAADSQTKKMDSKTSASSREPLLTSLEESPLKDQQRNGQIAVLPRLPGVIPVSGHNQNTGWL